MPISTSITNFDTISGFVYRACWMTEVLRLSSQISPAQAAAILGSWNATIRGAGPVAGSLPVAAADTKEDLATLWNVPFQLKGACTSFGISLLATFPEQDIVSHPCSNWGILIRDFAELL
jgi:hypothetical protein